jgi:hypothetical protein
MQQKTIHMMLFLTLAGIVFASILLFEPGFLTLLNQRFHHFSMVVLTGLAFSGWAVAERMKDNCDQFAQGIRAGEKQGEEEEESR